MAGNVEMVGFEPTCNQATVSTLYKSERIHLAARWNPYEVHLHHVKGIRKSLIKCSLKKPVALRAIAGTELRNPAILHYVCRLSRPNVTAGYLSQRRDSNPRISVLQTDALNHLATLTKTKSPGQIARGLLLYLLFSISQHFSQACTYELLLANLRTTIHTYVVT